MAGKRACGPLQTLLSETMQGCFRQAEWVCTQHCIAFDALMRSGKA